MNKLIKVMVLLVVMGLGHTVLAEATLRNLVCQAAAMNLNTNEFSNEAFRDCLESGINDFGLIGACHRAAIEKNGLAFHARSFATCLAIKADIDVIDFCHGKAAEGSSLMFNETTFAICLKSYN